MKFLTTLFLLIITFYSHAQEGPDIKCNNCEGAMNAPLPVNGSWFNPDQSGSGYVIEVQNGILLAYYFGYDQQGEQRWLIAVGELERVEGETDVLWQVTTEFQSFNNGNAINADYSAPDLDFPDDVVTFEFTAINHVRITVNGGPTQNFIPIVFGSNFVQEFEETAKLFPDMDGLWTFTYKRFFPEFIQKEHLYFTDIYSLRKTPVEIRDGTKFVEYAITKFFPFPPYEGLEYGRILCSNPINEETNTREVICEMIGFPTEPLGLDFFEKRMIVPLGDLGALKFSAEYVDPGEPENGFTIEANRVNYLGYGDD